MKSRPPQAENPHHNLQVYFSSYEPKYKGSFKTGGDTMRTSGILMPVFSLGGDYAIGTLGKSSFEFHCPFDFNHDKLFGSFSKY